MRNNRRFLRLWSSHAVSTLGDEVYVLAVPLIALQIGGSASLMTFLVACGLLPHAFFGVIGGVIADQGDRVTVLRRCYGASFLVLLPAWVSLAFFGAGVQLTMLAITALALSSVAAVSTASIDSLIPQCVASHHLARANSMTEASRTVAAVAGPSIAGYLVSGVSPQAAVALNCLSFLFAAAALRRLAAQPSAPRKPAVATWRFRAELREGLSYLLRHRQLLIGVTLSTLTNLALGAYEAMLIFHLSTSVGLSIANVGLFFGVAGIASVLAASLLSWRAPSQGFARVMAASIAVQGIGILVSATPHAPIAATGLVLVSLTTVCYTVYWRAFRQSICRPELLGRVSGACRAIAYTGAFTGALLSTALLGVIDDVAILLRCSGVFVLAVGVTAYLLFAGRVGRTATGFAANATDGES